TDAPDEKQGMMIFRLESLFSWSEFSKLDRGCDDSDDDEDNSKTVEDLDKITLAKEQEQQKSAQIKIDLDLPSASEDDIPLGEGLRLPEWDYKKHMLVADRCLLQPMLPKGASAKPLPVRLQKLAKTIQAQFEQLRSVRYWLKAEPQGEELDLSAWLDFHVESKISPTPQRGLYKSFRGNNRDLSCLLLADLSMSTDAHLNNDVRVIDVVQDSMLLFGEALQSVGDSFAMYGFSSVKRHHVRFTMLKNFNERYDDQIRGRIQAIKPGFYTRMGAAIRQATKVINEQKSSEKLLLIITDGKPNDIDHYEGRFGIEDTHQAINEAKKLGIKPFCITIDTDAQDYLPYLFGSDGFTVILRPEQLPMRLPQLYHQLTTQ
ncbi:MAG: nitric oxide reductase NorD protein, partial [Paraglaciecola sp.]